MCGNPLNSLGFQIKELSFSISQKENRRGIALSYVYELEEEQIDPCITTVLSNKDFKKSHSSIKTPNINLSNSQ